jgi:DNA repair protein RecN (Recombination protein N)
VLVDLHIKNLAVLAGAEVTFGPGLNVLTGETGAGKSIVVDSLALLAGARAATDLIRTGAESLTITGVFRPGGEAWRAPLLAAGIEVDGDELVVRREIGREGRNRVFLADQPATLRLLSELAPFLLRIHGQREELGLVAPDLQRAWLDRSGGADAAALLAAVGTAFGDWQRLAERLGRLHGDDRLRRERLDLLRFQAAELDQARPVPGEEDELRAERDVLRNVEAIRRGLATAAALLDEDDAAAVARLTQAHHSLQEIAAFEPAAADWAGELAEARIRVQEVVAQLERRLDGVEADPRRLDVVEDRLATLERLFRKYGDSSAALLQRRLEVAAELEDLDGDESQALVLADKVTAALVAYRDAALRLSERRRLWGQALAEQVTRELAELALGRAVFRVALERRSRSDSPLVLEGRGVEFGAHGLDQVVFLLAANPGEEAKPLARAASGGELARLYLAVQLAAAGEEERYSPTLVFDEADAGLGGAEAAALGRKLQRLARDGQIFAVTHLPQVASHADLHFRVSKRIAAGRTHAEVERLDAPGRVAEVARMLAGKKVTALSVSHAEELLAVAGRGGQ